MVFYKPVKDINEISKLFPNVKLCEEKIYGAYVALEQGENYEGKCLVKVDGMYCEISNIETNIDDKLLVEGLLRAALNFAGNRNAYISLCSDEKIKEILSQNKVEQIKQDTKNNKITLPKKHSDKIEQFEVKGKKIKGYMLVVSDTTREKRGYTSK